MVNQPVITIDGPSGAGKGTLAAQVADHFGWHLLDSGALYRIVAYAVQQSGTDVTDIAQVTRIARELSVSFRSGSIIWQGDEVTTDIRTEQIGNLASQIAALPSVRAALLDWQRQQARAPGLVADGRDMGTVVFPQAVLKIFLTASAEERAKRRYQQLEQRGITANISSLAATIRERDERDQQRPDSPLIPAQDATLLDSTNLPIAEVLKRVLQIAHERGL
ncbi:MAG: (d)CMP kinase [Pseudomonadota bacterium]